MIEKHCSVGKHEPKVHHGAECHYGQGLKTMQAAYLDNILEPYDSKNAVQVVSPLVFDTQTMWPQEEQQHKRRPELKTYRLLSQPKHPV